MRKLTAAAAIIVLIVIAYVGFSSISASGFAVGYERLGKIEARYGIDENNLAPVTMPALNSLENELKALRASSDESEDGKALKMLIDFRLDLLAMEAKFLEAKGKIEGIDPLNPDCAENGLIVQAKELSDEGVSKLRLASEKRAIFIKNYAAQAKIAGIYSNSDFENSVSAMAGSIENIKDVLDSYC